MTISTIPTSFPESAVQSSSSELSDELTTALAAGWWWAIMEVSSPISEEPEYGDLTSVQWWGTIKAGENPCPPSLVFSDESEKAESPHSGFSDATLNTKELWRQKNTQNAPMPPRSQKGAPVPVYAEKRDHTSSLVFNNASEKAESLHSDFSDATLKTTEQQRKWRQKKPQGPPVLAGSEKAECGNSLKTTKQERQEWRRKKPQGAPVPAGSPQGHPVPTGFQQRGKLRIPEHLRQHLLRAANELGALVPDRSPQGAPVPKKSLQREPVPASKVQNLKIPEPLKQELQQQKPQASSEKGAPIPNKTPERHRFKIPEPLRQELLHLSNRTSSVKGELVPQKTQEKKIPERLRQELLQVSPRASSEKGAPVPQKTQEKKIPERLRQELLQVSPRASSEKGAPVPQKTQERQRLKIPERLRQELLQLSHRDSSVKGELVPQKTQEKQRLKIPERLRQELLQVSLRASSEKGAPVPIKAAERQRLKISEPLRKELLQQKPQASPAQGKPVSSKSPQEAPLPDRNPVHTGTSQGAGVLASSPLPTGCLKEAAVPNRTMKAGKRRLAEHLSMPVSSTQGLPMPSRTSKVAPVYSGTLQGALVTRSSPRQEANPRITEQQKQKRREQWRQRRQQKVSDNIDVCEPPQKILCVEIDKVPLKPKLGRQNHQAPQPMSQLTLKMDHVGVSWSPPEKRERMANKIRDQQLGGNNGNP
ncbi:neurofilament heavy polypeptide-like [Sinocyclocheilus anshuiensis]|uniref:neurofilament heavy polypeptide-like n=1 Tax=Sinocyclocheilus anshuiensis TaxID=1608454 RepID=UPI0007BAC13E|nr:PREDICTED: neurofilament heavy polypeptide-like [Sinocyclocheilus anshuiensis]